MTVTPLMPGFAQQVIAELGNGSNNKICPFTYAKHQFCQLQMALPCAADVLDAANWFMLLICTIFTDGPLLTASACSCTETHSDLRDVRNLLTP